MDIQTLVLAIARKENLPDDIVDEIKKFIYPKDDYGAFLDKFTNLLFDPSKTLLLLKAFHPLLPELVERAEKNGSQSQVFVLLSSTIGHFRASSQYVRRKWDGNSHCALPYFNSFSQLKPKRRKLTNASYDELEPFLQACLTFLWYDRQFFLNCFDWSPLAEIQVPQENYKCRFLLKHCLRILAGSSAEVLEKLLANIPNDSLMQCRLEYMQLFKTRIPFDLVESSSEMVTLLNLLGDSLSPSIINVNGVLMHKCSDPPSKKPLVMVGSVKNNLRILAHHVVSGHPCIIEGPVGCGKTSLVEHLASITGRISNYFMKIQMGDQIDSKTLIGNYHCTEVPGEFVWKPGPLTECMVQGKWLLLEDIDAVSSDVLSIVISALKTRQLSSLPGCNVSGNINGDFRLFITRRTGEGSRNHLNEIDRVAKKVIIENLDEKELRQLIIQLYPSMNNLLSAILDTYRLARNFIPEEKISASTIRPFTSRSVSLRDLLKWVSRISSYQYSDGHNLASLAFKDAIDCFIPDPVFQVSKVEVLGKLNRIFLCFLFPFDSSIIIY